MLLPAGMEPEFYVSRFLQEFGVDDINGETTVKIPGANIIVPVNRYLFIDKRDMSWKVMKEGRKRYRYHWRRQFRFWRGENENVAGFAVLDFDKGVWTGVSIYDVQDSQEHPVDMENLLDGPLGYRRGLLLYKKKKA